MESDVCLPCTRIKSLFICPFDSCTKTFSKKSRLTHHVMTHTGERPHKCPVLGCNKKYVRAAHLKRHLQTNHSEEPMPKDSLQCMEDGCGKIFKTRAALNKHHRNQHEEQPKYKCTETGCTASYRKKCQLRAHLYSHKGVLPFQCEHADCKKKFAQKSHLERHKKIHNGYQCDIADCSQIFPKFSLLRRHRSQAHRSVFKCPDCQKIFTRPAALRYHSRVHSDSRDVFECPRLSCNRFYFSLSNLNAHIRGYHNNQRFPCMHEGCGRTFASKKKLMLHQKLHDPNRPKKKRKGHSKGGVKRSHVVTKLTGVPTSVLSNVKLVIAEGSEFEKLSTAVENCINTSGDHHRIMSGATLSSETDSHIDVKWSHTGNVKDTCSGGPVPSESPLPVSLTDVGDVTVLMTAVSNNDTLSLTDVSNSGNVSMTSGSVDDLVSLTYHDHAITVGDSNSVISVTGHGDHVAVTSPANSDTKMQNNCSCDTPLSLANGCKDIVLSQTDDAVNGIVTIDGVNTQMSHISGDADIVLHSDGSDDTAVCFKNNISSNQILDSENTSCLCEHLPKTESNYMVSRCFVSRCRM